ncbi:6-phospho-3-hexuloisomerase [Fervidicoccus fontis]|jgi:6-phospho-3-hexuloisomerase|uniref:Hexulose-6-phosphate isomerase n=2 Tax=Fervidicoccus fontis TaxID=683846 RepID=I0A1I1_FERFK|nr:6-phospho-3-hexuloisomerase [Fervidicoccus fontis]AFH42838.1 hexulose-6-phosphate isomerase [Fervidicoccus fontis Kam940]MBE9391624.1 6-phospho-3-hexuloisomerase [Fervidicoccus fontis]PMB75977.1 MAG: 6-phospho-3-hexuloisomerase [Fervidicoccus fontis]PMB77864.1 MAG: 6-phospho-3-hexuloisomerase [Fervidicoccus fontis]HEW63574.1 6-phospho-3-hexuloisomerase [Fervidicoccus fontis]
MEYEYEAMKEIATFINKSIDELKFDEVDRVVKRLVDAYNSKSKILVMGAGRSGLVGRAFAMRLMHLGFNSYVLGDTITPSISKGDIVVAISGSGRTELIITAARAAKKTGAEIIAVTSFLNSPLGEISDLVLEVPGRTKLADEHDYFARQILGIHEPLAPLGTLFEDTALVVLDGIVVGLMYRLGKKEEDLKQKHANIEL